MPLDQDEQQIEKIEGKRPVGKFFFFFFFFLVRLFAICVTCVAIYT